MIKVIACDVDGILTNLYLYQEVMVKHYFLSKGKEVPKKVNPDAYDIAEIYGLSKRERSIIWLNGYKNYRMFVDARINSFKTLKYWQERGRKIALVTSPAFVNYPIIGPKVKDWCYFWLDLNDFVPDEIVWCPEKDSGPAKAQACKDLKSDVMIEDKVSNLEYTLEVCDSIALPTPYNRDYQPENKPFDFYINNDWIEINETINELDNKPRRLK